MIAVWRTGLSKWKATTQNIKYIISKLSYQAVKVAPTIMAFYLILLGIVRAKKKKPKLAHKKIN